MSYCLLCNTNYKPKLNFEKLFLMKKHNDKVVCPNCLNTFEKITVNCCFNCSRPGKKVDLCVDCQRWKREYKGELLENRSLFKYNQALHDVMVNYKRYGDYILYQVLVELIRESLPLADYYVPVPTSESHFKRRQFDTVSEIYKSLVPLIQVLEKHDDGLAQGEKNRQQRLETLQSFYVNEKLNLKGNILILDDIYTTGRTLYHARDALAAVCPDASIKSFTIAR